MPESYPFDHAAQVVPDIAEAIAWYRAYIPGTVVLHADTSWGFIECGGTKIAFVTRDAHPNHLAWRVTAEELVTLAATHGKTIKTHRDGTTSFYLTAPGDNGIEFICYDGSVYPDSPSE